MSIFCLGRLSKESVQVRGILFTFVTGLFFYGELLAPRPPPKLEDHPLSAVRDCLFNILAAALQNWRTSPPSATWGRAMPWWQGTHLTWTLLLVPFIISEDILLRLRAVTTFTFGRGYNVKSFEAWFKTSVACSHTVYWHEGTAIHFDLAKPQNRAIPIVSFKVSFSPAPFGVLTKTVKFFFAFLFSLGFTLVIGIGYLYYLWLL
jgi:hypothetical protein